MKIFNKIMCKIIIVLAVILLPKVSFASELDNGKFPYCDEVCKGARVSFYDANTKEKIKSIDMVNVDYEIASNYRILSKYSKIDIMGLNGTIDDEIKNNIDKPKMASENLYKYTVSFPNFFVTDSVSADERKLMINSWFSNEDFIKIIFDILNMTNSGVKKWNDGTACLLIEPLVLINTDNNNKWLMTSAELGICALNGMAENGELYDNEKLNKIAYSALPYGTFKEENGVMNVIKPYSSDVKSSINTNDGYKKMVDMLGVLEENIYNSTKVSNYEGVIEQISETEKETIDEKIENDITKDDIVKKDETTLLFNKMMMPIVSIIILLIIILIVIFNKRKNCDDGTKRCNRTDCYHNKKGHCTSDVINKWNKQCDKSNDYRYFE